MKEKDCNAVIVEQMLRGHFPAIKIASDMDNELTFYLPVANVNKYPRMLDDLQRNQEILHITRFSIHICSLEELFLKADLQTLEQLKLEAERFAMESDTKDKKRKSRKSKKQSLLGIGRSFALSRADLQHFQAAGKQNIQHLLQQFFRPSNISKKNLYRGSFV